MSPRTGRPRTGQKPPTSIRIDPVVYRLARVASVSEGRTLGSWLEDAIREKLERDATQKDLDGGPEC